MSPTEEFEDFLIIVDDEEEKEILEQASSTEAPIPSSEPEPEPTRDPPAAKRSQASLKVPSISFITCSVTFICLSGLLYSGAEYYLLGIKERPFHYLHSVLRPSGKFGLLLGVAGTGLMVLNLSYLIRKRLAAIQWLGTFKTWMRFHVVTGLIGPALILFHTGFAPYSAMGMLALSTMTIVVLAGILGRYIYAHVPRSNEGQELDRDEVRLRLRTYKQKLEKLGLNLDQLKYLNLNPNTSATLNIFVKIGRIITGDKQTRQQLKKLKNRVLLDPNLCSKSKQIFPLLKKLCQEHHWLTRYNELRSLMSSWRFLHRWLAIVMIVVVILHVVIAVAFGDLWMLKGVK